MLTALVGINGFGTDTTRQWWPIPENIATSTSARYGDKRAPAFCGIVNPLLYRTVKLRQ